MDPMMEVVEIEAKDKLTSIPKLLSRSLLETHGTDEGAREEWNLVSIVAPQEKSDERGKRLSNKNMKRKKKKTDDEKEDVEKVHQLIKKLLENESDNNDPAEKAGKKLESPSNAIDDVTQLAGSEHVNSAVSVGETDRDTATDDGWGAVSKLAPTTVHKNRSNNTNVALTAHGITDGSFFPTESTNIFGIAVLSCVVIVSVFLVRVTVVKKQKRKSQAHEEATIARSTTSVQEEIADSGSIATSIATSVDNSRSTSVDADDGFPHCYYFDGTASVSSGSYEEDTDVAMLKEYIRKIMNEKISV